MIVVIIYNHSSLLVGLNSVLEEFNVGVYVVIKIKTKKKLLLWWPVNIFMRVHKWPFDLSLYVGTTLLRFCRSCGHSMSKPNKGAAMDKFGRWSKFWQQPIVRCCCWLMEVRLDSRIEVGFVRGEIGLS